MTGTINFMITLRNATIPVFKTHKTVIGMQSRKRSEYTRDGNYLSRFAHILNAVTIFYSYFITIILFEKQTATNINY